MTRPVISCRNVGILYYEEPDNPVSALNGVFVDALDIPAGGITAVMGPSGSGKSTLLSLVSGLKQANTYSQSDHASRVDLAIQDHPASDVQLLHDALPGPGMLGYVFQESHLMKALPVGLNLEMARSLTMGKLPPGAFEALMASFRFADGGQDAQAIARLRDTRVRNLSGGQQQRIAVGRAVASAPRLIFCDEPTSSLDPITAAMIMDYLADWAAREGGTVLWVTHDEELALTKANHILYVQKGQVISDDGTPVALPANMDMSRRRVALERLKARGSLQERLTQDTLTQHGMALNPPRANAALAREPKRALTQRPAFNTVAILRFVWHFVVAELFERQAFAGRARSGPARLVKILWQGPYSFTKPTFALILCLGLVTAYASILGFRLLDSYFERSLSRPEVAHFVLNTRGKPDENTRNLLTVGGLKSLGVELAEKLAADIPQGTEPPQIFGRRFDLFATVARGTVADCQAGSLAEGSASLLVYQHKEPLYQNLTVQRPDGPRRIADFSRKDLRGQALVTPTFLRRVLRVEQGDPLPAGFCFNEYPRSYVTIAGVVDTLPGSKDLQFEFAMTNDAYLRIMKQNPPNSWQGRFPPFQSAALYFDAAYAEQLFCSFDTCASDPAQFVERYGAFYKLDDDAMSQVRRLIRIAVASQSLLFSILAAMLVAVTIALALSVKAFIDANERFLCIMRAVGYRLPHLATLFCLEFAIITAAAALPFALLLGGFHVFAAPWLSTAFALPPHALSWNVGTTGLAFVAAYVLVAVVGLIILALWWLWNRHVGHKLQGL